MPKRNVKAAVVVMAGLALASWMYFRRRSQRRKPQDTDAFDIANAPVADVAPPTATSAPPIDERRVEVSEGVSILPADGWARSEGDAPTAPNMRVVFLTPGGQPSGSSATADVPTVVFTIEDLRATTLSLADYVQKCIVTVVEQTMMMSQGRMRPRITANESCEIGPFRHRLEYVNEFNGHVGFGVCAYLGMVGSVGINLQLMTPGGDGEQLHPALREMATTVRVDIPPLEVPFTEMYFVRRHVKGIEIKADPSWSVDSRGTAIVVFRTPESDELLVYSPKSVPANFCQLPEIAPSTTIEGIAVTKRKGVTVYSAPTVDIVHVHPQGEAPSVLNARDIVACVKSVRPSTGAARDVFVAVVERLSIEVEPTGCIIVPQFRSNTISYLPLHNPMTAQEPPAESNMATCSIIFDPSVASLQEWNTMLASSEIGRPHPCALGKYQGLMVTQNHPHQPVTHVTLVLPGESLTYCFQWEAPTSAWEGLRPVMDKFKNSLRIDQDCSVS